MVLSMGWPHAAVGRARSLRTCASHYLFVSRSKLPLLNWAVPKDDLWKLHPRERTHESHAYFMQHYAAEQKRSEENGTPFKLWRPVVGSVRSTVLQAAVLRCLNSACSLSRPLIMQQILLMIEEDESAWFRQGQGWILAMMMAGVSFGEVMGVRQTLPPTAREWIPIGLYNRLCLSLAMASC